MSKKLITLIITFCMMFSLFSGLPVLPAEAADTGGEGGEAVSDIYATGDGTSEVSLLGGSALYTRRGSLEYLTITILSLTIQPSG
jgi:hypothetical protein